MGHGLLIIEASRSHLDTPQFLGLPWTSDQTPTQKPLADNTQETDTLSPPAEFEPATPACKGSQTHSCPLGSALGCKTDRQNNVEVCEQVFYTLLVVCSAKWYLKYGVWSDSGVASPSGAVVRQWRG